MMFIDDVSLALVFSSVFVNIFKHKTRYLNVVQCIIPVYMIEQSNYHSPYDTLGT